MLSLLVKGARFIKSNPGLLVSLLLIVLIPLLIFFLSSYLTQSFQENIDLVLQKETLALQSVLSPYVYDYYQNPDALQQRVKVLAEDNPELSLLRILLPGADDEFRIIASHSEKERNKILREASLTLAWHQNQAIAFLSKEQGIRYWNAVRPFYSPEGEKIGLISLALSLEKIDEAVIRELEKAYIFALISIIIIIILVIHHTRLFSFVALSKRLQELDKMKDNFIRMATHELQSPVINIRGYIEVLEEEISSLLSPDQKEFLHRAKISAKNLSDLIYDILEVARIEQGRLDLTPSQLQPGPFLQEIVKECHLKALSKGLVLTTEIEPGPAFIKVNANRLRQILINLIENAIKYTPRGKITVKGLIDAKRKRYIFEIEDTGLGIAAENQARLFERFYRVKTKETADIPGTGLGLWIAKQLTEKMGGKIFVESMEKVGTKFTVTFPLMKK